MPEDFGVGSREPHCLASATAGSLAPVALARVWPRRESLIVGLNILLHLLAPSTMATPLVPFPRPQCQLKTERIYTVSPSARDTASSSPRSCPP